MRVQSIRLVISAADVIDNNIMKSVNLPLFTVTGYMSRWAVFNVTGFLRGHRLHETITAPHMTWFHRGMKPNGLKFSPPAESPAGPGGGGGLLAARLWPQPVAIESFLDLSLSFPSPTTHPSDAFGLTPPVVSIHRTYHTAGSQCFSGRGCSLPAR